jgi:hypothetical protein
MLRKLFEGRRKVVTAAALVVLLWQSQHHVDLGTSRSQDCAIEGHSAEGRAILI